jgi:DNA repair exonuclease SbcCD ATPase subunit
MQIQADTTGDLSLAIQAARAAAQRLNELEAIRQQAATLPALEREQERRAQVSQARPQIDAALSAAHQKLAGSAERMSDWAQRLGTAYRELEKLAEELSTIQLEIDSSAPLVKRVAGLRNFVDGTQTAGHEYFVELPCNNFAITWDEVGGTDPALDPLAGAGHDDYRRQRLHELIEWLTKKQLLIYSPFLKPSRRYERI